LSVFSDCIFHIPVRTFIKAIINSAPITCTTDIRVPLACVGTASVRAVTPCYFTEHEPSTDCTDTTMTDDPTAPKSTEPCENKAPWATYSPWHYRCPNGHTTWTYCSTKDEYESCGLHFNPDELVDVRTDGATARPTTDDDLAAAVAEQTAT